jgi:hypothetical protein
MTHETHDPHQALDELLHPPPPEVQSMIQRFSDGFPEFIQQKRRKAVIELLQNELPRLVADKVFIEKVLQRLGPEYIRPRRFVFVSLNPKIK